MERTCGKIRARMVWDRQNQLALIALEKLTQNGAVYALMPHERLVAPKDLLRNVSHTRRL